MKKNALGAPVHGSYGTSFVIHHPPLKITKVSCQMCRWYDIDDHSCSQRGLGPKDRIDHWKKCEEFVLDPEYIGFDVKNKIKAVKGKRFLDEMLVKSNSLLLHRDVILEDKENEVQRNDTKDECSKTNNSSHVENSAAIKLEGQIYVYKNHSRCIIVSQDQKYYDLKFESGKEAKFDKKTLIKNRWLKKL